MQDSQVTYLDSLAPFEVRVGYGDFGRGGDLGYEGKHVVVQGRPWPQALSTHAPARLFFKIGGQFGSFEALVALNDDVPPGLSSADFSVMADGRLVAAAPGVVAGEPPRPISGDLRSAKVLELAVNTSTWDHCHAVWLDPRLFPAEADDHPRTITDCLDRAEIQLPLEIPHAECCIATVASAGFESLLDDMLGSLLANGCCTGALLVVFCVGDPAAVAPVAAKYGARIVHCKPLQPVAVSLKSILYSVGRVVEARRFLCIDADMLVVGDLQPVFALLDACPNASIAACREENSRKYRSLGDAIQRLYLGDPGDVRTILGKGEAAYPLVVNDGLFAGSRAALLSLDSTIRAMREPREWMDARPDVPWRNQFLFNLALAKNGCGIELHAAYNFQLNRREVRISRDAGRVRAESKGEPVRVVHFNGDGRNKLLEWRGVYARVADPLPAASAGDGYTVFLNTLRAWVGLHGLKALAWSFYGTADARTGRVADAGTMPLLAALHYLVRSNGCVRVLETGTARGVSAACMASAVTHREGGRVVTFDPAHYPERDELWAGLPEAMRDCLEARLVGSLEGMAAALQSGERFDAALLDSIHTAEHVWAEFELARQLVSPGGLILIHDASYAAGTVGRALAQVRAAGYGVVRLWTAEQGVREDAGLGLAVIENRIQGGKDS